jgi:hypothetical protein
VFDPHGLPLPDSVAADHPRCRNSESYRSGLKARCGAARSGMGL